MLDKKIQGSIFDQMRKNRWRTAYLLIAFPIAILLLTYLGLLIAILFSSDTSIKLSPIELANEMMSTIGFWVIIGVFIWTLISYFLGSRMIMAFAHAKPIEKRDHPILFRAVENASIAAGLPKTPDIYIIDDHSMNAFATGTNPKNSKVAISKGLLENLEKAELEAVMAHEIGHILNRDIRVMLIAITLVGAIQMIGEILIRTGYSGRSNSKSSNPLPLIGILFLTIGVIIGTLTRLALSREREYLADATSAHLTSNPDALARALAKISSDARLEVLDKKASMSGLCIADPTASGHRAHVRDRQALKLGLDPASPSTGLHEKKTSFWQRIWSTHPPISDRISRLMNY